MNTRDEQNILMFSACSVSFFALLALVWGVLAKSQMIIFDGIYSSICLLMDALYYYTAKTITKGSSDKFPYGRMHMEPLVIMIQSAVLILICAKAFIVSVSSLFSGVGEINNLSGMGYAAIGVVGCLFSWWYIARTGKMKVPESELVKTNAAHWKMDTLLSLAVMIGFFIAYLIERAGYVQYSPYVDPLMVMLAVLFFVRQPIVSFIEGIKGMLIMAPVRKISDISKKAMKEIAELEGFDDVIVRVGKSGRELVYEVSFIAQRSEKTYSVDDMDRIHRGVENRLHELFDNPLWLHVSFVHDRKLG
ncbi:MAG: cation transporter [Deltaproteobacteria bacterium]|jgi:predicted Co/Zn/Cd cation transporter (cation efflux family)|nr:cation transporter [Deltaproteobacteria bacterium]